MKKILILLFMFMPIMALAQSTLTPQEQLEQAQKQLEEAQKALEAAKANAAKAEAEAKARQEAAAKAKAEAEAKAKAEAEAKAKADAEAKAKAAEIQKQIDALKQQTAALEEQAAKLNSTSATPATENGSTKAVTAEPLNNGSEKAVTEETQQPVSANNVESPKKQEKIRTRLTSDDDDDADKDDKAKYLAKGAVPLVNGKVEWSTTIKAPGKTADQIYAISKEYLSNLVSDKMQLPGSQVVANTDAAHSIAATVHEWLVFRNSAISLDRAEIFYLLEIKCNNGSADVKMSRIKYKYSTQTDTESYLAEKWITDKEAVNKKRTRLYPLSGKFRRKTIDRKDEIFETLSDALQQ